MVKEFLFGIFGVFIILSFQFISYIEPFAVMIITPHALIGVIWGHILMGLTLTMPSIMGVIPRLLNHGRSYGCNIFGFTGYSSSLLSARRYESDEKKIIEEGV